MKVIVHPGANETLPNVDASAAETKLCREIERKLGEISFVNKEGPQPPLGASLDDILPLSAEDVQRAFKEATPR